MITSSTDVWDRRWKHRFSHGSGVATLPRSNLSADTFPMTALYEGDATPSAILDQVITETTSAAILSSSPNPATQDQAVTFIVQITSSTVTPSCS
jgi:hypothetical protein